MRRRALLPLLSLAAPLLLAPLAHGCATGGTIEPGPTTPAQLELGASDARNVVVLSDLDTTRGVARGSLRVFVATDRGVLSFPASGSGEPTRYTTADGLPSDDVTAVAVDPSGAAVVSTTAGLARITGTGVTPMGPNPPVGDVRAMLVTEDRTGWACGSNGVAKTGEGGWQRVATVVACTGMWPDGDAVWIGTTSGLWRVEAGDVIREHAVTQGIPEGYVRDVMPLGDGEALALLQGPNSTRIGYWDGVRWFGYTIDGLDPVAVGFAPHEAGTLLVTPGSALLITKVRTATTVPLRALSVSNVAGVRSWTARLVAGQELEETGGDEAPTTVERKAPSALVTVPDNAPTVDAPPWLVSLADVAVPRRLAWVARSGGATYFAVVNGGLVEIGDGAEPRELRSRDLVTDDLQIAIDSGGNTLVLGHDGQLARWTGQRFARVPTPEDATPQAIATGPEGAYLLARRGTDDPATFTLYKRVTNGWSVAFERYVDVEGDVLGAPFMTVGDDGVVWAGLRVRDPQGRERMRGAMRLDPTNERVTYYHRGATPETDGEGAIAMPDEVNSVETTTPGGFVWFGSLSGAIRVGDGQAVVFGEARGVRGEVVTDVLLGLGGRMWLAAAEGLGFTEGTGGSFQFPVAGEARRVRPARIALDAAGDVWGAGSRGVLTGNDAGWRVLDADDGLPTSTFEDVELDARDRVWLLAPDRVVLLTRESGTNTEL